jgi:exo-1,4-beta-D-glucosaminidase
MVGASSFAPHAARRLLHASSRRCCCDAWQHWKFWQEEQYSIASASLRDQFLLLSSHPSVLAFMLSSDELPPPDVEAMCPTHPHYPHCLRSRCFRLHALFERYNNVTRDVGWLHHAQTVSAAAAVNSSLSGLSGVKMSGPYSWVLLSPVHHPPPPPAPSTIFELSTGA